VLVEKRKYRQRFITTRYKLPAAPPHDLIRSDVSFIAVIPTPSDSIRKMSIKRKKKKFTYSIILKNLNVVCWLFFIIRINKKYIFRKI
jgi:hypothetical protein